MGNIPEIDFKQLRMTNREVLRFAEALASAAPDLVRVGSIGNTREGTPIVLLTITDFADRQEKFGYFVQGNIHSHELGGTLAGLYLARQLVADHRPGGILSQTVFYIIARCNPDGAERIALHSGSERSAWGAAVDEPNRIAPCDIDDNGRIYAMRVICDDGDMIRDPASPEFCMIGRREGDSGPYYRHLPEGMIENWDGHTIPAWNDFARAYEDWNRNWPTFWHHAQFGAGTAPLSEPEVRLQADFLETHPEIIGGLAFHNGWGACLTPPNTCHALPENDQKFFDRLAEIASAYTGYPAYRSIHFGGGDTLHECFGQFPDYCFYERKFHCMLIELGTIENSAGLATDAVMNLHDTYTAPYAVLALQQRRPELEPAIIPWKKFEHPQLGEVEIGGLDVPVFANPTPEDRQKVARGCYLYMLEHIKLAVKHFSEESGRKRIIK